MSWHSAAPSRRPVGFITPQIHTPALKVPVGPQWIHEIKHDGDRLIVRRQGERVRLFTRRGYGAHLRSALGRLLEVGRTGPAE